MEQSQHFHHPTYIYENTKNKLIELQAYFTFANNFYMALYEICDDTDQPNARQTHTNIHIKTKHPHNMTKKQTYMENQIDNLKQKLALLEDQSVKLYNLIQTTGKSTQKQIFTKYDIELLPNNEAIDMINMQKRKLPILLTPTNDMLPTDKIHVISIARNSAKYDLDIVKHIKKIYQNLRIWYSTNSDTVVLYEVHNGGFGDLVVFMFSDTGIIPDEHKLRVELEKYFTVDSVVVMGVLTYEQIYDGKLQLKDITKTITEGTKVPPPIELDKMLFPVGISGKEDYTEKTEEDTIQTPVKILKSSPVKTIAATITVSDYSVFMYGHAQNAAQIEILSRDLRKLSKTDAEIYYGYMDKGKTNIIISKDFRNNNIQYVFAVLIRDDDVRELYRRHGVCFVRKISADLNSKPKIELQSLIRGADTYILMEEFAHDAFCLYETKTAAPTVSHTGDGFGNMFKKHMYIYYWCNPIIMSNITCKFIICDRKFYLGAIIIDVIKYVKNNQPSLNIFYYVYRHVDGKTRLKDCYLLDSDYKTDKSSTIKTLVSGQDMYIVNGNEKLDYAQPDNGQTHMYYTVYWVKKCGIKNAINDMFKDDMINVVKKIKISDDHDKNIIDVATSSDECDYIIIDSYKRYSSDDVKFVINISPETTLKTNNEYDLLNTTIYSLNYVDVTEYYDEMRQLVMPSRLPGVIFHVNLEKELFDIILLNDEDDEDDEDDNNYNLRISEYMENPGDVECCEINNDVYELTNIVRGYREDTHRDSSYVKTDDPISDSYRELQRTITMTFVEKHKTNMLVIKLLPYKRYENIAMYPNLLGANILPCKLFYVMEKDTFAHIPVFVSASNNYTMKQFVKDLCESQNDTDDVLYTLLCLFMIIIRTLRDINNMVGGNIYLEYLKLDDILCYTDSNSDNEFFTVTPLLCNIECINEYTLDDKQNNVILKNIGELLLSALCMYYFYKYGILYPDADVYVEGTESEMVSYFNEDAPSGYEYETDGDKVTSYLDEVCKLTSGNYDLGLIRNIINLCLSNNNYSMDTFLFELQHMIDVFDKKILILGTYDTSPGESNDDEFIYVGDTSKIGGWFITKKFNVIFIGGDAPDVVDTLYDMLTEKGVIITPHAKPSGSIGNFLGHHIYPRTADVVDLPADSKSVRDLVNHFVIESQKGGSYKYPIKHSNNNLNKYFNKYIKYKLKYLALKNKI